jgi:hypothetical protein
MRRPSAEIALFLFGAFLPALAAPPAPARASGTSLPTIDGIKAVAVVNGDPIALAEVERQLAKIHMQSEEVKPASQDPSALLDRLITAKLVAQEAREAGFNEEPEFLKAIDGIKLSVARDILIERETKNLKADPALVEKTYKDLVREYTMGSVFFKKEQDAKEFEAKIKGGGDFFKLAKAARDAGKGTGPETPQTHKASELTPGIARLMTLIKPGETGPIMQSQSEWAFVHLVSVQYPDSPDTRLVAQSRALEAAREEAILRYAATLRKKYATIDEKLLASLDFEKKDAVKSLSKDTRPLVSLKGDAPITVADLAEGMQRRFFHGVENAASDPTKKINAEKTPVLEDVINRRVVAIEARGQKIQDTKQYKEHVARSEDQILFEMYVKRAILPEVKVTDADVKAYYDKHKGEYTTPEMIQLEGLVFTSRADAQAAFTKLQKGAEWNWLKANAPGRVAADKQEELSFPKGLVVTSTLPAAVQKAVKGSQTGDYRFYEASASGPFEVLVVRDLRPSKVQDLEAVKKPISNLVYAEKLSKTVEENAAALRRASKVEVFATGDQLKQLIMKDLQGGN